MRHNCTKLSNNETAHRERRNKSVFPIRATVNLLSKKDIILYYLLSGVIYANNAKAGHYSNRLLDEDLITFEIRAEIYSIRKHYQYTSN